MLTTHTRLILELLVLVPALLSTFNSFCKICQPIWTHLIVFTNFCLIYLLNQLNLPVKIIFCPPIRLFDRVVHLICLPICTHLKVVDGHFFLIKTWELNNHYAIQRVAVYQTNSQTIAVFLESRITTMVTNYLRCSRSRSKSRITC